MLLDLTQTRDLGGTLTKTHAKDLVAGASMEVQQYMCTIPMHSTTAVAAACKPRTAALLSRQYAQLNDLQTPSG
jgi:hypothetical protein